ncbi:ABC transporter ATP-binding protein [Alcaligenaceae bacterium]|nr:ABC transporter ATP-binding protein [Alcaligenaceae bacterium]
MSSELLQANNLVTGYGKIQALWDVSLAVKERETVVLIGPNGAGKTTLIKTLMGLVPLWTGEVIFNGKPMAHERTDKRVRAGIGYMSEIGCFLDLSVQENLLISGQFLPSKESRQLVESLYDRFPTLQQKRKALASSLSGGERKILGVAKALAAKPQLLVMDEPSAGLSPVFVKEVIRALRQFRDTGLAFLIAEQNIKFLEIADRVYTLEGGRIGFEGTVPQMHDNAALERAYFGLKRRP